MTISEDTANQPSPVHITTTSGTTGSFSPQAATLLVAMLVGDGPVTAAETGSVSDSGSHTWTRLVQSNTHASGVNAIGGFCEVWVTYLSSAPGSITVTGSWTPTSGAAAGNLVVRSLLGAASTQTGVTATAANNGSNTINPTVTLTPTQVGSWVYGCALDYTTNSTLTANGSTTSIDQFNDSTNGDTWATFKGAAATTTLTSTTFGYTNAAAAYQLAAVEILPAATSIPWNPQRTTLPTDPGTSWWIQRDRRDANTVATPANPLPSPLDTAWQADANYWHLYADAGNTGGRSWMPQQRPYISDPSLLAGNPADPLLVAGGVGGDTWRRYAVPDYTDRRLVPAQRPYVSDPNLLTTALLENELLGGADDLARHRHAGVYTDRRFVPQQRAYVSDPNLLATALLEGPLLGGADDLTRHRAAAEYIDQRLVPRQRLYISDPLLLTTALLESPLLGGADDLARHANTSVYLDRRLVPQQRPYVSDPSLLATALLESPLLGGADDLTRHANVSTYLDRRLVPQQRPYVSDPLLLTTALLESPLLGGFDDTARHQSAAEQVDRREVPQQRIYISPPGLLDTAELENELLGGATTGLRSATPATHADRRLVPQQRAYISTVGLLDTALLESPLLGEATTPLRRGAAVTNPAVWWMPHQPTFPGPLDQALLETPLLGAAEDLRRRQTGAYQDRRLVPDQRLYISGVGQLDTALLESPLLGQATISTQYLVPATHSPRWWMPQQPARQTWYFDAGPGTPPLTLAWGADGNLVLLYNTAGWQPDRRLVPQQRSYISDPSFYPVVAPIDPLTVAWGAGGPYWHLYNTAADQIDRRLVPQQRAYISDPTLLSTALLEGVLLGGADDRPRRWLTAATHTDRRQVPQQRTNIDPLLLTTALLESPLLGAADDLARHALLSAYLDRRLVPAQRAYISPPGLLDTALLETPLLGGADDLQRRFLTAVELADRRLVPQQRVYFDPSLLATALLESPLLGGATTWTRHGPATHTDRRAVPQQRPYVSNPDLLATALLESPLLGAVDSLLRHATWFTNPPAGGQQAARYDQAPFTPPTNPADPLLVSGGVGGDTWRRYQLPGYGWRPLLLIQQRTPTASQGTIRDLILVLGQPAGKWQIGGVTRSVWQVSDAIAKWTIGEV